MNNTVDYAPLFFAAFDNFFVVAVILDRLFEFNSIKFAIFFEEYTKKYSMPYILARCVIQPNKDIFCKFDEKECFRTMFRVIRTIKKPKISILPYSIL